MLFSPKASVSSFKSFLKLIYTGAFPLVKSSERRHYLNFFDGILAYISSCSESIQVIHIGANDGITADPIFSFLSNYDKSKLSLIAVEPDPSAFKHLPEAYAGLSNVQLVNAGIIGYTALPSLYRIKKSYRNIYLSALSANASLSKRNISACSSFDKEDIVARVASNMKCTINKAEHLIEEIPLPSLTYSELIARYQVKSVDLLVLGMNNFDGKIISDAIDLGILPKAIYYKSKDIPKSTFDSLAELLRLNDYTNIEWRDGAFVALRKG